MSRDRLQRDKANSRNRCRTSPLNIAGARSGLVRSSTADQEASSVSIASNFAAHIPSFDVLSSSGRRFWSFLIGVHIVADLGFMIAMHSWHELSIHTKGALRNGVTEAEIREVVMQSMVYCGVPSGVQALKVCETAINEMVEGGEHQRQLKEKV